MAARSKLTYRQIANLLLDLECGMTGLAVAAEYGITPSAVSLWKPYMGLNEKWLGYVKWLELESKRLKRRAEMAECQVKIGASVIKQLERNPRKRSLFASAIRARHDIYRTRANAVVGVSGQGGALKKTRDADAPLIAQMRAYLDENPGDGFGVMFRVLLQDRGCTRFHALTLYRKQRLALRFRKNRVYLPGSPRDRVRALGAQDRMWALDFLVDALPNGKRFWVLNAIDEFNRECLFSKALARASTRAVVAELEAIRMAGRVPKAIRSDNGGEFKGLQYLEWARRRSVRLRYSRPSHPEDNPYVERLNGTLRQEVFNWFKFKDLAQVQRKLDEWRIRYNMVRPHHSLGGLSPMQYAHVAKLRRSA